jgi:hypothetical protein
MSHTMDYLTRLSGPETDNTPKDEMLGLDRVGGTLYTQAHNRGGRGQHSCAARAAENLARLCLGPSAPQGVQLRPAQATDTTGQKDAG